MSIFVDPNEQFPLAIGVKYVKNELGQTTGVKIVRPPDDGEPVPEGIKVIRCAVVGADWESFSNIIELSGVINSKTGNPMQRTSVLFGIIINNYFRDWSLMDRDEPEQSIPITTATVGRLHYKIVRALARKWLKMVFGITV